MLGTVKKYHSVALDTSIAGVWGIPQKNKPAMPQKRNDWFGAVNLNENKANLPKLNSGGKILKVEVNQLSFKDRFTQLLNDFKSEMKSAKSLSEVVGAIYKFALNIVKDGIYARFSLDKNPQCLVIIDSRNNKYPINIPVNLTQEQNLGWLQGVLLQGVLHENAHSQISPMPQLLEMNVLKGKLEELLGSIKRADSRGQLQDILSEKAAAQMNNKKSIAEGNPIHANAAVKAVNIEKPLLSPQLEILTPESSQRNVEEESKDKTSAVKNSPQELLQAAERNSINANAVVKAANIEKPLLSPQLEILTPAILQGQIKELNEKMSDLKNRAYKLREDTVNQNIPKEVSNEETTKLENEFKELVKQSLRKYHPDKAPREELKPFYAEMAVKIIVFKEEVGNVLDDIRTLNDHPGEPEGDLIIVKTLKDNMVKLFEKVDIIKNDIATLKINKSKSGNTREIYDQKLKLKNDIKELKKELAKTYEDVRAKRKTVLPGYNGEGNIPKNITNDERLLWNKYTEIRQIYIKLGGDLLNLIIDYNKL